MYPKELWQGLPYHPISLHYKSVFGQKVYKIPLNVADTCPNREGLRGMQTCNFCDVWGSAAYPDLQKKNLREQIETSRSRVLSRVNAAQFLAYFQSYTTTFAKVAKLRHEIEIATEYQDIVGLVIGTRPDCISDALIELLNGYAEKFYVAVEIGVQTFDESQLRWMRRGHTAAKSIWAIQRLSEKCPRVNLGIHLMLGLPNESDTDIVNTAEKCNALPIHNVKLHNLHVLTNTPLAEEYARGEFTPLSLEAYADRAILFLEHLHPRIAVHRLAALSSRPEELVAPKWTSHKMATYQFILDKMNAASTHQGKSCHAPFSIAPRENWISHAKEGVPYA